MQRHLAGLRRIGVIHARAIAPTGDWHRQEYVIDLERFETLVSALRSAVAADGGIDSAQRNVRRRIASVDAATPPTTISARQSDD